MTMERRSMSGRETLFQSPEGLPSVSLLGKKKHSTKIEIQTPTTSENTLSHFLFPGLPDHYPLRKKIMITKSNSTIGSLWDVTQVVLSLLACAIYIADTYANNYEGSRYFVIVEIIVTQFFMLDFLLNWYLAATWTYLYDPMSLVDILTIIPVYVTLGTQEKANHLSFLRFARILRLVRIFRTFKALRNLSGIKRQLLSLSLTLLSMTFLAAGLVQLMENEIKQLTFDCQYINENTNWEPSCSPRLPADQLSKCDCERENCIGYYQKGDNDNEPSGVRCINLTYFDAFYFIIVTVATVGYGDISPTTTYSRAVVLVFIVASLVVIPMQINKLQVLLSLRSPYRNPYKPQQNENHVILCGHVNDRHKLEKFFKEFFHPDRAFSSAPEFHAVVLSPVEPTEDVRNLLLSPVLDSRVTYVIGSALSVEDLKRVRADIASGMFFLCNTEVQESSADLEDAATVLRALSVSNFNPNLDCLVQVLRPEDRTILKDSDVDVILCLDEFKTALQARNAICPGFSTFVENIFHSFGSVSSASEQSLDPWYNEYLHGARMEMYCLPLDSDFLRAMDFNYSRIVEAVYLEYEVIIMGLCSNEQDEMTFNPTRKDITEHKSFREYFQVFTVALIIADDQMQADRVARGIADMNVVSSIIQKMDDEEFHYPVKRVARMESRPALSRGKSFHKQMMQNFKSAHSKYSLGTALKNMRQNSNKPAPAVKRDNQGTSSKISAISEESEDTKSDDIMTPSAMVNRGMSLIGGDDDDQLSESDDETSYVGYVKASPNEIQIDRRMSAQPGGGVVSSSQHKIKRPLVGARKALVSTGTMQNLHDSGKSSDRKDDKIKRADSKEKSDKSDKSTVPTPKSKPAANEDEEEEGDDAIKPLPSIESVHSRKLNSMSLPPIQKPEEKAAEKKENTEKPPDAATTPVASPIPAAAAAAPSDAVTSPPVRTLPRPLMRAATAGVGVGLGGSPKLIRKTLKEMHGSGGSRGVRGFVAGNIGEDDIGAKPPSEVPPAPITSPSKMLSTPDGPSMLQIDKQVEQKINNMPVSQDEVTDGLFGLPSREIDSAVSFSNHIIVFGNDPNLPMFVSELRRPTSRGDNYHPIVIVSVDIPSKWDAIKSRYNDVYVIRGSMVRTTVFNRANVPKAFAVILLASRDGVTKVEEENIDSGTLFTYLKLEQFIPRGVFFSVELTCSSNMAVLNATIMRRVRRTSNPFPARPPVTKSITRDVITEVELAPKSRRTPKVAASPPPSAPPSSPLLVRKVSDDGIDAPKNDDNSQTQVGRFTSKRSTIRQNPGSIANLQQRPSVVGRRTSTVELQSEINSSSAKGEVQTADNSESEFWDATDTHHMLPVFASARAYVPSSFESLLVQSFFGVLTPLICEKLVCGQNGQSVMQVDLPRELIGRRFVDLFRLFLQHQVIVFGLYRAPQPRLKSWLPYIFISPPPNTILGYNDKVFLYGKPSRATRAVEACVIPTNS